MSLNIFVVSKCFLPQWSCASGTVACSPFRVILQNAFRDEMQGIHCHIHHQIVEQFCLLISAGCRVFCETRSTVLCRNNVRFVISSENTQSLILNEHMKLNSIVLKHRESALILEKALEILYSNVFLFCKLCIRSSKFNHTLYLFLKPLLARQRWQWWGNIFSYYCMSTTFRWFYG